MLRLILRSLLVLVGSALVGSLVVFLLLRAIGGDVAVVLLGEGATPERLAAVRAELGLDRSWAAQYFDWLSGLLRGDLGHSYGARYDIFSEIRTRLGLTFALAVASLALSWIIAVVAGTYAAFHAGCLRGRLVQGVAQVGVAVPAFWVGLVLIAVFSVRMGWLPSGRYVPWSESPLGAVGSLTLPVLALSTSLAAVNTLYVRSSMLEVLNEDYIRTAIAKGRTRRRAVLSHGVRNASVVLVTVGILQLGSLLAGTVVIENVFTLPGLGQLLVFAVTNRETIVVQSLVFVILLLVLFLNFIMDIAYGLLDPRIRDADMRVAHG